jgi:hypothetical protein
VVSLDPWEYPQRCASRRRTSADSTTIPLNRGVWPTACGRRDARTRRQYPDELRGETAKRPMAGGYFAAAAGLISPQKISTLPSVAAVRTTME